MSLRISSPSFDNESGIPVRHTCEGDDVSPALNWTGAPDGTASFVLIVDDPDAPDPAAPRQVWTHWILYDLPPTVTGLPEDVGHDLPDGTGEGLNDWNRTGWGGPCPPIGRHRYYHKLYALSAKLGDMGTPRKEDVEGAMKGHVLATAQIMGTYQKRDS